MTKIEEQVTDAIADVGVEDTETAARLLRVFEQWQQAREYAKTERKRVNEQLAGKIALFAEAMNVGHSNTSDEVLKLSVVETRWQDLEDARDERKTVGLACRDAIKACEQKIKDLLSQARQPQLPLFQSEAEPAHDGDVETDAA